MIDLFRLLAIFAPSYRAYAGLAISTVLAVTSGVWIRAASLMVVVALGGCASLPSHVERPASHAQAETLTTSLARVVASSTPAHAQGFSGVRLMADGEEAFQGRLALIGEAQKSLDVQYYQIASDRTGLEFLAALRDAAKRGVRVRVLVDDLYASGEDELFASLAAAPNVEVRVFNPLPVRGDRLATRLILSLHEFSRINHRMHNKLFVADASLAVVGGRNIADEYFGRSEGANFVDTDALLCGSVVSRLEAVFDSFWNSEHAYPIEALVPSRRGDQGKSTADGRAPLLSAQTLDGGAEQRAQGIVAELASGRIDFNFGAAEVFADEPTKVTQGGTSEGGPSRNLHELLGKARSRVFVSSPYVVPGLSDMAFIAQARGAGVDVEILTNSMQSTDEPLVAVGFARHAAALAALGVDVREVKADASSSGASFGGLLSGSGSSLSRLHAKLMVIDGHWSAIGSFNLDRRSALWNTEMVVRLDSVPFAQKLEGWAETNASQLTPVARKWHSIAPDNTGGPQNELIARFAGASWWQRALVAAVGESLL